MPPSSGLLADRVGATTESSVEELHLKLVNTQLPLFECYRAMFALRNIGSPAAVDALAAGFLMTVHLACLAAMLWALAPPLMAAF